MARQNSSSPINVHVETRYLDDLGEEVHVAHYREEMIQDPATGDILTRKVGENMTLGSGESFNPSQATGANPVLLTGTCSFCVAARKRSFGSRNRMPNPLCNVKHLRHCHICGRPACLRHIRFSKYDKKFRCLRHHRLHRLARILGLIFRGIFFERVEG